MRTVDSDALMPAAAAARLRTNLEAQSAVLYHPEALVPTANGMPILKYLGTRPPTILTQWDTLTNPEPPSDAQLTAWRNVRDHDLRAIDEELCLAHYHHLTTFVADRVHYTQPDKLDLELMFPYIETYGSPYLYGYELWALRQARHRWATLPNHPDSATRLEACDKILHRDEDSGDAPRIRHMRLTGQLGGSMVLRPIRPFRCGSVAPPYQYAGLGAVF